MRSPLLKTSLVLAVLLSILNYEYLFLSYFLDRSISARPLCSVQQSILRRTAREMT